MYVCLLILAELFAKHWRQPCGESKEIEPRVFLIKERSPAFGSYYDEIQDMLKAMAGLDDFLQGIYEYTI